MLPGRRCVCLKTKAYSVCFIGYEFLYAVCAYLRCCYFLHISSPHFIAKFQVKPSIWVVSAYEAQSAIHITCFQVREAFCSVLVRTVYCNGVIAIFSYV